MKKKLSLSILAVVLVVCLSQICYGYKAYPKGSCEASSEVTGIEFHFIKVGQGDCTLIKCPNGRNVLVDCGSSKEQYPVDVRKYLSSALGDNKKIDTLVITHPHSDHYNMLPYALNDVNVVDVLLIGDINDYNASTYGFNMKGRMERKRKNMIKWLEKLDEEHLTIVDPNYQSSEDEPSDLFGDGETEFYILAAEVPGNKNTRSIALMVSYKEFDVILTGDATETTEENILNDFSDSLPWLDCEVLKMGHHGSESSTTVNWVKVIKPEVSIACAALGQVYGHPRKTTIDLLEDYAGDAPSHLLRVWRNQYRYIDLYGYDKAIYSTATNGMIMVWSDGLFYYVTDHAH